MSSFQRRFASLLSTDNSSPSSTNTTTATTTTASAATSTKTQSPTSASTATANSLTPDMALFNSPNMGSNMRLSPADRQHHQRPVSEILKPESFISPETQALDKWFEDLQQYESSLESMATASLDPKYKEEVQHVDQWFRYLNEAERTATIYTLLQHSTQVQIRFFITVLQQMDGKDPVGALLSPAHPEKVDMQAQLTGAMKKAELEASQKLLSVLPYQAGQVIARPNSNAIRRQHIDRHSFALGDTEEYDHLFSRVPGDYALRNSYAGQQHQQQQQQQRGMFDHPINTRPKSVIEGNSSIFSNDWSYGNFGQHHQQQQQQQQRPNATVGANRPKSADISNWSFGLASSVSSKSVRDSSKDSLASPWSGLSPTVSTFGEQQQQQQQSQQQQHNEMDQQLSMMANKWSLRGGGGGAGGNGSSNRSSVILSDDTNGFKRRAATMSIPETADEQYHVQSPPTTPAPVVNNPAATNIVLSLYDESASTPSTSTQLFGHNEKRGDSFYKAAAGESSPVPSQSTSMNLFSMSTTNTRPVPKQQQQQHTFGQFLNPNDRIHTSESVEAGYHSDHSDTSNRSNGSKSYHYSGNKKKAHYAGNNGGYYNNALRNGSGGGGGGNHAPPPAAAATTAKENKKNIDVVDMSLLEDIPAWLRSLRLHKYNPIFETMKWQDMLKMDDEALLNQGVAALGARRKLLKVFDQVKAHCAAQNITY